MLTADVLIVGAGPAGAATAINLAPFRHVVLVERRAETGPRIGESLVPAARRLLSDMGLLESFRAEGHEPWHANRSVWGSTEPQEIDFLRTPDGHGWHLDRPRFERWLRDAALKRGAELICPATLTQVEHDGSRWRVIIETAAGQSEVSAELLIDAGGRTAPLAHKLCARSQVFDRLVCAWIYGRDAGKGARGLTYIEAEEEGWWYTAPLPGGRRVLAFHTDADLPSAREVGKPAGLLQRAGRAKELSAMLVDAGFVPETECSITAAHSAIIEPCAGEGWLTVGDAAVSFDPLSSQGLFHAMFTGLAAAEAADRQLKGDPLGISEYVQTIRDIRGAYRQHLSIYYSSETRWPEAPFWRRRRGAS